MLQLCLQNNDKVCTEDVPTTTSWTCNTCMHPPSGVADIKDALLFTLASTSRGASVSKIQRGIIEEAQIALESYGTAIDYVRR